MSDNDKIDKWFKTHKFLTIMQCIHKLGVYNGRSRIAERSDIKRAHFRDVTRDDGKVARIAVYAVI